ncbi:M56 family metallopeptidase [Streptomyces sp. N2-109]|uniref:M56 family metallopeptidase n=1 Tax=Streptomyces gossypii TaxID=2883101 RepID=A0ABT2JUP3_9ACTN|nr:M56 family metallopeptidase [Streptomyces gossypii]MCT2591613.1 M56 family metallopeptidase [Streptomyces gossypii]
MSSAALLLGYGLSLALAAPALARAGWPERAPRLGIWAWQALTASMLLSVVLAGLVVTVSTAPVSGGLGDLLQACGLMIRAHYEAPGGPAVAAAGSVLALAVAGRTGWCLTGSLLGARRERRAHARVLALVGTADPVLGVTVVEDARPAVYCLPGLGHRIVLTSAALAALEPKALTAVIAHERAHIRGRHHLVLAYAGALERAFPFPAIFRAAAVQTRRLVEMAADDEATACADGPLPLAGALLELAGPADRGGGSAASLAAGGDVAPRIRRLLGPRRPLRRAVTWIGAMAAGGVLVLPFVLAAHPAVAATSVNACPLPYSQVPSPSTPCGLTAASATW